MADDARYARALGFGGKLAIHPRQVGPICDGFAPDAWEIAWARRVLAGSDDATAVDGAMRTAAEVHTEPAACTSDPGASRVGRFADVRRRLRPHTRGDAVPVAIQIRQIVCGRCGTKFSCGSGSSELGPGCWCQDLPPLDVRQPESDCLCRDCLSREIDRQRRAEGDHRS